MATILGPDIEGLHEKRHTPSSVPLQAGTGEPASFQTSMKLVQSRSQLCLMMKVEQAD